MRAHTHTHIHVYKHVFFNVRFIIVITQFRDIELHNFNMLHG
jgi:hypothetical protein